MSTETRKTSIRMWAGPQLGSVSPGANMIPMPPQVCVFARTQNIQSTNTCTISESVYLDPGNRGFLLNSDRRASLVNHTESKKIKAEGQLVGILQINVWGM